jgi:hypothetical protein
MAEKLNHWASQLTSGASSAVHGAHGTGEALRGTINSTIDGLVPNKESKEGGGRARNEAIHEKGMSELHGAEEQWKGTKGGAFRHGHSLRGEGRTETAATEHNHQHHQAATGGQGKWLSKGGIRGDEAVGSHRVGNAIPSDDAAALTQAQSGNTDAHAGGGGSGLGAARHAWGGQQGTMGPGAHAGSVGNLESNPAPVQDFGGEGETRREAF